MTKTYLKQKKGRKIFKKAIFRIKRPHLKKDYFYLRNTIFISILKDPITISWGI